MYTRRSVVLGLLATALLSARESPQTVQVTGAVKLVVPKDKPGGRSVRMLTRLEVVQVRK